MLEIDHNGPGFFYKVYWRLYNGTNWNIKNITDWQQSSVMILNQPSYTLYKIKVAAVNERGEANVAAEEVNGWSGEDSKDSLFSYISLYWVLIDSFKSCLIDHQV